MDKEDIPINTRRRTTKVNLVMVVAIAAFFILCGIGIYALFFADKNNSEPNVLNRYQSIEMKAERIC